MARVAKGRVMPLLLTPQETSMSREGSRCARIPLTRPLSTDSAGHQQWVANYGNGNATAIAVDGSGNVYVTGYSAGVYATVKYNSVGEQQWAALGPPNGSPNSPQAIALDGFGNVYVTAMTGDLDYGTIKYNSAGQQQWLATYNGPMDGWDEARGIAVDGSGNVYVTGQSEGLGTRRDYATVKYNVFGQEQWVARYNGPGNDWDGAEAIALDGSGNVYVTGESVGSAPFLITPQSSMTPPGSNNGLLATTALATTRRHCQSHCP